MPVNKNIEPGGGGGPNSCSGRWGKTVADDALPRGLLGPIVGTPGVLRQKFLYPPFSVLNTRDGDWQRRKKAWISLGIQSEVGRGEDMAYGVRMGAAPENGWKPDNDRTGTSIFDPVLCELAYRWWAVPGGVVVDPFAGGSVRGIVAAALGLKYWGCDLSAAQVAANRAQRDAMQSMLPGKAKWVVGDSAAELPAAPLADFLISCPPYGNLEIYSDDPRDVSSMGYDDFRAAYANIIGRAVSRLRDDRFACFVVANFRDRDGGKMRNLVGDTISAFAAAGADFYNDIVLVNAVGTGAMRMYGNFDRGARKVVKTHQNALVFVKGDPKKAAARIVGGE